STGFLANFFGATAADSILNTLPLPNGLQLNEMGSRVLEPGQRGAAPPVTKAQAAGRARRIR
ncbi:MAG TPA: hypothetical protein VHS80_17385, partial [Chthoniobacterales bacterium]|nr:hypothetical protein [Chthoniobacterales bacterium]